VNAGPQRGGPGTICMYCNIKRSKPSGVDASTSMDEPRRDQRPVATPTEFARDSEEAGVSPPPTNRVTRADDICLDGLGSEEEAPGYGHGV